MEGSTSQTSQELLSRTPSLHSSETASDLPEIPVASVPSAPFPPTQNEGTLLLFKYKQTQAKREEMKNHFPTGKKQERLFTLSLTALQYSLAFPSL